MPRQPRTSRNKSKGSKKAKTDRVVPYANGFKCPSAAQTIKAVGFDNTETPAVYRYHEKTSDGFEFFRPIPPPTNIDDWLAQYNEPGQSYMEYLHGTPWLSTRKRKYMTQEFVPSGETLQQKYPDGKIYIVPIGDFDHEDSSFYSSLLDFTRKFLGLPVVSLPKIKLEEEEGKVYWVDEPQPGAKPSSKRTSQRTKRQQMETRYNSETQRVQVRVDSKLMKIRQMIPDDAICMVGLTMYDLYGEDSDLFVAGMAAGNERVAIFSLYRYDPCLSFSIEHWYQVEETTKMNDKRRMSIVLQRSCKLLVHEICHLLGVGHCVYFDCCMNGSGHLTEDFRQPMQLCPVDLHKLHTLVGFDPVERYKELLAFYKEHGFKEEETWVEKRLMFIEKC